MSGAEIVQVVSAVSELARLSYQLFQFFQRLRKADKTAAESCRRVKELHRVVDGVELALHRREKQISKLKTTSGEEKVWRHVRSSVGSCHKALLKIRREYTPFNVETDPSIFERAVRQIRFEVVRKEALIDHYNALDTQLQMLQVNTQTLNIFIQVGTNDKIDTSTGEILDAIARLQVLYERGNTKLDALTKSRERSQASPNAMLRLPSISVVPVQNSHDASLEQDSTPTNDIEMMKETLSSAWDVISSYEPVAESVADRREHLEWDMDSGIDDPSDYEDAVDVGEIKVTETVTPRSPGARSPSFPRPTASNLYHDHSRPLRVLDGLVKRYQLRVETALEKNHVHSAEEDQLKAMEYAEERSVRYNVPFDRVAMQEQLALIYKRQSKHEEVFKVLTDLLPKVGDPSVSLTLENTRHHQMIGETYYELWTAKNKESDLEYALAHAMTAFNGRERLEEVDELLVQESAKLLADVYEALDQPVEAEVFREMLPASIQAQMDSPPQSPAPRVLETEDGDTIHPITQVDTCPPDLDVNVELVPAIKSNNLPKLRALLQSDDVDLDRRGRHNWTPLMYAFKYSQNSESMPLALLEKGFRINDDDDDGRTVLHQAAAKGQATMVRLAIRRDATKEAKDKDRLTPLLVAVKENHKDAKLAVEALLENEVDVKARDKDGWTILHYAAHNSAQSSQPGNSIAARLLDYLLEKCMPDIEAKDRQGYTPLCQVAGSGDANTVAILLKHGADPNACNRAGRSPLYLAMHQKPDIPNFANVIKLLIEHNALVNDEEHLPQDFKKFKYLLKSDSPNSRRYSESKMSIRSDRTGSMSTLSTILTGDSMIPPSASSRKKRNSTIRNLFLKSPKEEA